MRGAGARPRGRPVFADARLGRRRAVVTDDRRIVVDLPERGAVGEIDLRLRLENCRAHRAARLRAGGRVHRDLRMRRTLAVAQEIVGRLLNDARRDRPPLRFIGVDQPRPTPALHQPRKLPAEIVDVAHAGVEAEAAGRRVLVRGVAGEEDASFHIVVGDEISRDPRQRGHHLVRDLAPHHLGDHRRGVDLVGILEMPLAADAEPPQLAPIELHQRAPDALRVGEEVQRAFAVVVIVPQLLHAEEDVEIVFERRHAVHGDAERLLDRAGAAAAGDQIVARYLPGFAARAIGDGRDNAAVAFHERFEARAHRERHGRKAHRKIPQDRIEPELVAALRPLRADRRARSAAVAGAVDARDLVAGEARQIEHGMREVGRRAGLLDALGDPPAAEQLHGARVLRGGAGMRDRAVALLHHRAFDAAPAEIGGEPEPDRPAADDQDRCVRDAFRRSSHRLFPCKT